MKNNYRFCQPSFLYSLSKTLHDSQEGYLSELTYDMGTTLPQPQLSKAWIVVGI